MKMGRRTKIITPHIGTYWLRGLCICPAFIPRFIRPPHPLFMYPWQKCVYQPQNVATQSSKVKHRLWRKERNISWFILHACTSFFSNCFVNYAFGLWMSVSDKDKHTCAYIYIYIYQHVKAIIDVPFCDWAPGCRSEVALRFQSSPRRRSLLIQLKEQGEQILKDILDLPAVSTASRSNLSIISKFFVVPFHHWIKISEPVGLGKEVRKLQFYLKRNVFRIWFNTLRSKVLSLSSRSKYDNKATNKDRPQCEFTQLYQWLVLHVSDATLWVGKPHLMTGEEPAPETCYCFPEKQKVAK
jgi:hypothetical protein